MTSALEAFKALWLCLFWPLGWFYFLVYFLNSPRNPQLVKWIIACYFVFTVGAPGLYYLVQEGFYQLVVIIGFGFFALLLCQEYFIKNNHQKYHPKPAHVEKLLLYSMALLYDGVFPVGTGIFLWVIANTHHFFSMSNWKLALLCVIALSFGLSIFCRNIYPKCSTCLFPLLRVDMKNQDTLIFNVDVFRGRALHCPR